MHNVIMYSVCHITLLSIAFSGSPVKKTSTSSTKVLYNVIIYNVICIAFQVDAGRRVSLTAQPSFLPPPVLSSSSSFKVGKAVLPAVALNLTGVVGYGFVGGIAELAM